jgi:DNA repair exonuclease SbcCD ATPase subunit
MLKPVRLKVRGFRGFAAEQDLRFDAPVVLLVGENHQGKSSTLNAIEWCLYGEECYGGGSGIRERINWEVANRYLTGADVRVELHLQDGDAVTVLTRSLRRVARRARPQQELTLAPPDGQTLTGADAEAALRRLLRTTFRDFTTTVYQHQEVIRALLTDEPLRRNDALDRLLGLAAHRNLVAAIDEARLRAIQRQVVQAYEAFRGEALAALNARRVDLLDKQREAAGRGLAAGDLTRGAAVARGAAVHAGLVDCARAMGARPPAQPPPDSWEALPGFIAWARADLRRLSAEIPEARGQAQALARQRRLLKLQADCEALYRRREEIARALAALANGAGGVEAMAAELQRAQADVEQARLQARRASARRSLVREALALLEAVGPGDGVAACPLCGSRVEDLWAHLKEEYERATAAGIRAAEEAQKALEARTERLREALREHDRLTRAAAAIEAQLGATATEIAAALDRPLDLFADPLALLNRELEAIDQALRRAQAAIEARQQLLDRLEDDLDRLKSVVEVVVVEERRRGIEQIRDTLEYRRLETLRDEMARWIDDVESVKGAIVRDAHDYARRRIEDAQGRIDAGFRLLTNHPALSGLRLRVSADAAGKNAYLFSGPDGRDLVPVLSQGDMNALALAIFLGLARSDGEGGRLGFVMLDDPSQSLGSAHKRRLVELLNEVAREKTVILSTMDHELEDMLRRLVVPLKQIVRFSDWTPARGPLIEVGGSP